MARILLKRGLRDNLPALALGEPAYCTDTGELFIGSTDGNVPIKGIGSGGSGGDISPSASGIVIKGADGNNYEITIDSTGAVNTTITDKDTTVLNAEQYNGLDIMDARFGVVGDGITDDTEALRKAHDYANANNLPVKYPALTFMLKNPTSIIKIQTATNFGLATIIIDESFGDLSKPRFRVDSMDDYSGATYQELDLGALNLTSIISKMKRGTTVISEFASYSNSVCIVSDSTNNTQIRTGGNSSSGKPKSEVFVIEEGGRIVGGISQDFTNITSIRIQTMEESWLTVEGGKFYLTGTSNTNLTYSDYPWDCFHIRRCRTTFRNQYFGLKHGNADVQYEASNGVYNASSVSDIVFENIRLLPRVYETVGGIPQGTYAMGFSSCMNITMRNVRGEGDATHWGIYAPNNIKNLVVEECEVNRVDTHFWCWNARISNSYIGMKGVSFTGGGKLTIENSEIMGNQIVDFREDYGAFWDGDIHISNTTLLPFDPSADIHLLQWDQTDYDYKVRTPIGRSVIMRDVTVDYRYMPTPFTGKAFILYMPSFGVKTSGYRTEFPKQIILENIRAVGTNRKGFTIGSVPKPYDMQVYGGASSSVDSNGTIATNCNIQMRNIDCHDWASVDSQEGDRNKMTFLINVADTAVYSSDSVVPSILMENCGKIFTSFKSALANVVIRNCTINCFDNLESTGKTKIVFDNCLFQPDVTSNKRVYYVYGKQTFFTNCTFDIPKLNGVATFSLDYGIITWDTSVQGNMSNCRCTEAYYAAYNTANGTQVSKDFTNLIANGTIQRDSEGSSRPYKRTSGTTANRPTGVDVGFRYYDTTLGKPIYCKVAGTPQTWTDATGVTV